MTFVTSLLTDPQGWYRAHQLLVGQTGVNALLAISIWVTLFAGQLTLANIGFMAIGGYTTVILAAHAHAPLLPSAVAGCGLAGGTALVVGLPVLRLRGAFLAIATIGFSEFLRFGLILNLPITGRGQGLGNPAADPAAIWPVWASVAVAGWIGWRVKATRAGVAWAAIAEDEVAARSGGIDTTRYKLAAFMIGAVLAAWAGALDAHINFFIDPGEYAFNRAVFVLILAVVGGVATVAGPILGAIVLTALPEAARAAASYRDVVFGTLLIAIVVFRPEGIVGPRRPPPAAGARRWRRTVPGPDDG